MALIPGRELEWIEVNPAPADESGGGPLRSSTLQKADVYNELKRWRLETWKKSWRDDWPSYGPKTLVSNCDLESISNRRAGTSVFTIQDIRRYTHIIHWPELGVPLMDALRVALILSLHGSECCWRLMLLKDRGRVRVFEEVAVDQIAGDVYMSGSRPSTSSALHG